MKNTSRSRDLLFTIMKAKGKGSSRSRADGLGSKRPRRRHITITLWAAIAKVINDLDGISIRYLELKMLTKVNPTKDSQLKRVKITKNTFDRIRDNTNRSRNTN
ncbi:hypothetical protein H5410_057691 [Solanum commersonii]|uniref:Uncharacterized protein n=1 Tax=Solanum commersonii TaxID=4109 RepID=A0A9J5WQG3_SOLCO|nr:hypothetical protein H5410_057691 [Solanum commersonii]